MGAQRLTRIGVPVIGARAVLLFFAARFAFLTCGGKLTILLGQQGVLRLGAQVAR